MCLRNLLPFYCDFLEHAKVLFFEGKLNIKNLYVTTLLQLLIFSQLNLKPGMYLFDNNNLFKKVFTPSGAVINVKRLHHQVDYSFFKHLKLVYLRVYNFFSKKKIPFLFLTNLSSIFLHSGIDSRFSVDSNLINKIRKYLSLRLKTSVLLNQKFFDFNAYKMYFLRKNKNFNKSRYSRNRQLYRTGVY